MQLYLVYCVQDFEDNLLSDKIEAAAGGEIKEISITTEQANELLDQAFPKGWKYHSYLISVNQGRVSGTTGHEMFIQLRTLLGPQEGWQVYSLAQQYGVKLPTKVKRFPPRRSVGK